MSEGNEREGGGVIVSSFHTRYSSEMRENVQNEDTITRISNSETKINISKSLVFEPRLVNSTENSLIVVLMFFDLWLMSD